MTEPTTFGLKKFIPFTELDNFLKLLLVQETIKTEQRMYSDLTVIILHMITSHRHVVTMYVHYNSAKCWHAVRIIGKVFDVKVK